MRIRRSLRPRWTRSKTQVFAVALVVLGAVQANIGMFSRFLTEENIGILGSCIGAIVFILRAYTTSSLHEKEEENAERLRHKWRESDKEL